MRTNDTRSLQWARRVANLSKPYSMTVYSRYAASAGSKEGNKNTDKGADVPCTDPDYAAKQAASDEATSNNTHNAQAEGDKQQM
ncbi:hypothetical protein E4U28_006048 [Claviceps purpurea]|nr:hypothetical protein E4U28_006048 [Claviceps purpurea]KAG6158757.1 hypothetical protein E4U37_005158 [Claviceps purpurea]